MKIDWNEVLTTLGSTAILIAAIAYVGKSLITYLLKRDLSRGESQFRKKEKEYLLQLNSKYARDERIREELLRWSNPILGSVKELKGRLENILDNDGYLALSPNSNEINPDWSITYDYYLRSTVFLFCQYSCNLELFREQLRFEVFITNEEKDRFFEKSKKVGKALSSFPHEDLNSLPRRGDMQVFHLQQKMLGGIMIVRDGDVDRCMRYSEFDSKWDELESSGALGPLIVFLRDINETDQRRWRRLELMKDALDELQGECESLISQVHE